MDSNTELPKIVTLALVGLATCIPYFWSGFAFEMAAPILLFGIPLLVLAGAVAVGEMVRIYREDTEGSTSPEQVPQRPRPPKRRRNVA